MIPSDKRGKVKEKEELGMEGQVKVKVLFLQLGFGEEVSVGSRENNSRKLSGVKSNMWLCNPFSL